MPTQKTRVLITGAAGFVGHHFVNHLLVNTDWDIVALDKLSYASNGIDRLRDIDCFDEGRVLMLTADFTLPLSEGVKQEIGAVDYIMHIGAESHVDNSILDPLPFAMSNVIGTVHMLNFARELNEAKDSNFRCFMFFGTDEVFGPAPVGTAYKEDDRHNPGNPYAASKSGAEMFVKAYGNTYKLPTIITRSMNIIGERQHPEKFVALVINKILNDEKITIHANKEKTQAGQRMYIHARNVADAYLHLINKVIAPTLPGEIYLAGWNGKAFHIVGEQEVDNLQLVQMIAKILGKGFDYEMVDFHSSRPGHDLRYALDGKLMADYGWTPPKKFEESLAKTVEWFISNPKWLEVQ